MCSEMIEDINAFEQNVVDSNKKDFLFYQLTDK